MSGTILLYEAFSGISGDMNLGGMIDLGVPLEYLQEELKKLNVSGFTLSAKKEARKGIFGTKASVDLAFAQVKHLGVFSPRSQSGHAHEHRGFSEISNIINKSGLKENVKQMAINIFKTLAIAEAKVHNSTLEQVGFHEVGALDAIVDICAAAIAYDYLKVEKVIATRLELGSGFVKCAHGTLAVPVPAVTEIVKGFLVRTGGVLGEATTPTGAAILANIVTSWVDMHNFSYVKSAYGVGNRDTDKPNVVRVSIITEESSEVKNTKAIVKSESSILNTVKPEEICFLDTLKQEEVFTLVCNIDDMDAEALSYVMEALLNTGALDVWFTSIIMKKSRPGTMLSVLCKKDNLNKLEAVILSETTTLGIRIFSSYRIVLERNQKQIQTSLGMVRIKETIRDNLRKTFKLEYEDVKKIALEKSIPLLEVYSILENEVQNSEYK